MFTFIYDGPPYHKRNDKLDKYLNKIGNRYTEVQLNNMDIERLRLGAGMEYDRFPALGFSPDKISFAYEDAIKYLKHQLAEKNYNKRYERKQPPLVTRRSAIQANDLGKRKRGTK